MDMSKACHLIDKLAYEVKLESRGDPIRLTFAAHLKKVSEALRCIEMVNNGKCGINEERESILSVISKTEIADELIEQHDALRQKIKDLLSRNTYE